MMCLVVSGCQRRPLRWLPYHQAFSCSQLLKHHHGQASCFSRPQDVSTVMRLIITWGKAQFSLSGLSETKTPCVGGGSLHGL